MRCYLFTSSCSLAALALVALFSNGAQVAGDGGSKQVIQVGVYYESLCGDSIRWIKEKLAPSYEILKDHINLTFVPYGKASQTQDPGTGQWQFSCQHGASECEGNMAQACAINAIQNGEPVEGVQQLTAALVTCAMTSRYPPSAVPQCAKKVGLSDDLQKSIDDCIAGPLSKELLAANGDRTAALNPALSFVPTITINGEYQSKALHNFLKLICEQLQEGAKPSQCTSA
ncbi:gamma-interferon-inducible lysosomal thiol reductase 1 isoform X2 [Andrena cerasifolii]|uniref:gamma-interferon-inducible lysosomal thiol reductase 1 isoform X2 n=1 Tax=Andrena cerasifolii TaxID=2819439 RepID=UPI0040378C9F